MSHVAEQATRTKAPGPRRLPTLPAAMRGGSGGATSCADAGSAAVRTAIRQASRTGRGWRTAHRVDGRSHAFRQVRLPRCDPIAMEAATPLPFAQVRVVGERLYVDGLVVDDETAVRLARAAADAAKLVADAIGIGSRILDREQTGAQVEVIKAELEKATQSAGRSLDETASRV